MSQLSDWKRAHMCTENHVCFGRIHGSQLREGANAGPHTPTLSLPPSHHCLDGEVCTYVRTYQWYRGTYSYVKSHLSGWKMCTKNHVFYKDTGQHTYYTIATTASTARYVDIYVYVPECHDTSAEG